MNFSKTEDKEALVERQTATLPNKRKIQIGVWPTLYGIRVKAGYCREFSYKIDWCCADSPQILHLTYHLALAILSHRLKSPETDIFEGLPVCSKIKPVTLDTEFMDHLASLPQADVSVHQLPTLEEIRLRAKTLLEREEKEWDLIPKRKP